MKRVIRTLTLTTLVAVLFISCGKDRDADELPDIEDGTIQYKVNGNLVTIRNQDISSGEFVLFYKQLKGVSMPDTRYIFNGQKGVNHLCFFAIPTDSLTTQTYFLDSTTYYRSGAVPLITYNGAQLKVLYHTDTLAITITSYKNSLISGTFTGKFSPANGSIDSLGKVLITEGEFKNIKCAY